MASHGRKKRGGHDDHGDHPDERWLLTYADLITLLMALFMVLFSISSVNKSKFETLQRTLSEAFSGKVLPGGKGVIENGGSNNVKNPSTDQPYSSIQPFTGGKTKDTTPKSAAEQAAAARAEDNGLRELEKKVEQIASKAGLDGKVTARVTAEGLQIRVLTDDLLFDSGQATPKPTSAALLSELGGLLGSEGDHAVVVSGHTDDVPVSTAAYPSNWELSGDRASSVVRAFIAAGVTPARLTAAGKAELDPVAPNTSASGRTLNRRVEILLPRQEELPATSKPSILDP